MGLLDRHFVTIPGDTVHELPPLMRNAHHISGRSASRMLTDAKDLVAYTDLVMPTDAHTAHRELGLALSLVEGYTKIYTAWNLGGSILSWIGQCEETFSTRAVLRPLLSADVWPRASRASFVTLLEDKAIGEPNDIETSVGLRLAFRKLPPISCYSEHFIFYLNNELGETAYKTWADQGTYQAFPPERFHFEVVDMSGF